ncbi:hypothetical protein FD723_40145 (plasmid) [Nostoc sp. C052]|uniref:hypothetical protein n=1 Tax=Nostoc sp. C052 TaxID=2576902 RepID=UPI0015C3FF16|nr:hypothetical protein [Nostoc sp. C052]QLE46425.1 hypothetical protein FD723_40145 [Nostoc sp. C052]
MKILSNLGNSLAGVGDLIDAKKAIHWTLGLRQAELIILDKTNVLRTNNDSQLKAIREGDLLQEQLKYLKLVFPALRCTPVLGIWLKNKIADINDRLSRFEALQAQTNQLFRDCRMELDVARKKKQEILEEYPEAQELTYMQLQEKYGQEALLETNFAYIEARLRSAFYGFPESVGVALFDVSPQMRQALTERINQFIQQQRPTNNLGEAIVNAIYSLPTDRQQVVLGLIASEVGSLSANDENPIN